MSARDLLIEARDRLEKSGEGNTPLYFLLCNVLWSLEVSGNSDELSNKLRNILLGLERDGEAEFIQSLPGLQKILYLTLKDNLGEFVSIDELRTILERPKDRNIDSSEPILENYIHILKKRLSTALEASGLPLVIETYRNAGYRLTYKQ